MSSKQLNSYTGNTVSRLPAGATQQRTFGATVEALP